MILQGVDRLVIAAYLLNLLAAGLSGYRKASTSAYEFFVSGRSLPRWLLGVSMGATTFSADTPDLVTDMVRQHGVAGNWLWRRVNATSESSAMVTFFCVAVYFELERRRLSLPPMAEWQKLVAGVGPRRSSGYRSRCSPGPRNRPRSCGPAARWLPAARAGMPCCAGPRTMVKTRRVC